MRSEYYGSVKVTYFDKKAVWQALRELAPQLAAAHPEISKIVVFGSFLTVGDVMAWLNNNKTSIR